MTAGIHSIVVDVNADTYWVPDGSWSVLTNKLQANTMPIVVNISLPQPTIDAPEKRVNLTLTVIGVPIAIICLIAGPLLYRRHRNIVKKL